MEKAKTKKVNTKPAKKATTATKEVVVRSEEVTVKNQIDYSGELNKIFFCLVAIALLLFANVVVNVFTKSSGSTSTTKTETTEENEEYDVSEFDEKTVDEALSQISKGGTEVVYIGRPTCGYCVKFAPIMKQAQNDLGFKHIYIDLEKISSEDSSKLTELDSYIEENFGYTPMVLVFKDGEFVNGTVGYTDVDTYKAFLNEQGIK